MLQLYNLLIIFVIDLHDDLKCIYINMLLKLYNYI